MNDDQRPKGDDAPRPNPWLRGLDGLGEGPARLIVDEWRRFLGEHTGLTRQVCRTARRAMRAAAEETLKARDQHVAGLEARLATLEAEISRLRRGPTA
ncbi:MAG: hypothetical protein KC549_06505 [Myxococcales bacterium]|nr:hypothetical protein [Myxococcales bacterium]MCB9546820.1 hypothetical protein [Myxococcales bacterium]